MGLGLLVGVCIALLAIIVGWNLYKTYLKDKDLAEKQEKQRHFLTDQITKMADGIDQLIVGVDGLTGIGHKADQRQLLFFRAQHTKEDAGLEKEDAGLEIQIRLIDCHDLIDTERVIDRSVKTNKTGGKRINKVHRIELLFRVADPTDPLHQVAFLNKTTTEGSEECLQAMQEMRFWEGLVKAYAHQVSREPDLTVRLAELHQLQRQGVIDENEFDLQKAQLMELEPPQLGDDDLQFLPEDDDDSAEHLSADDLQFLPEGDDDTEEEELMDTTKLSFLDPDEDVSTDKNPDSRSEFPAWLSR
ncbi:MAG: hypothetical protein HN348_09310 [Proteobacteria bacterium]|nr:hypothetical protein [Pseudomonadota bacterium]